MSSFHFHEASQHNAAEESPGFLLWRVSTLWRREIEAALKQYGLTHPQFVILASIGWLSQHGAKPRQVDISRHSALDPNTTSQILKSLQIKGFIERARGNDERSKCTVLTQQGSHTLTLALKAVEEQDFLFFKAIDMRQMSALEALQKLSGML